MSRSLKKAPYVEAKLFSRVEAMNEKGEKKVLKTWSRSSTIFPPYLAFLRFTMNLSVRAFLLLVLRPRAGLPQGVIGLA